MTNTVRTDALHEVGVAPPVLRPVTHGMVARVVDATDVSCATILGMRLQDAAVGHSDQIERPRLHGLPELEDEVQDDVDDAYGDPDADERRDDPEQAPKAEYCLCSFVLVHRCAHGGVEFGLSGSYQKRTSTLSAP